MFTHAMKRIGTWYRVFNLAAGLVQRGHSVRIAKVGMTRLVPEEKIEDGVSILELPRMWGSSLFHEATRMPVDIAARFALQLSHRYDIVHAFTHHLNALLPALLGSWMGRGATVLGDRDDLWSEGGLLGAPEGRGLVGSADYRFHHWTEYNMARWLGTMTVVSDDLMRRVLETGVSPLRVRKLINGCPVDRIKPGDRAAARHQLGLPADREICLFVGVGIYDVDLVLDALAQLRKIRPQKQLPLTVIVGPPPDATRALADARGVAGDVLTPGFLKDAELPPYFHSADVGLLPFADKPLNWARFPIKLGDYLAAGLPVLTNDIGEMGRIVGEENAGEVTASNPEAYARGMARLLDDQIRLEGCRRRARAAAERMSWSAVSGQLEEYYLALRAGSRDRQLSTIS